MGSVGDLAAARGRTVEEILAACRAADVIAWSAHAPLDDAEVAAVVAVLDTPPPPPPTAAGFAAIGTPPTYPYAPPPPPGPLRPAKRTRGKAFFSVVGIGAVVALRVGVGVVGFTDSKDHARDDARQQIEDVADADFHDDVDEELAWAALAAGDCFDDAGADDDPTAAAHLREVDCAGPHDAEVFAVGEADEPPGADYPTPLQMSMQIGRVCGSQFATFVGRPYQQSSLDVVSITPLEDTWEQIDLRRIVCGVANRDGSPLPAGTVAGSGR